MAELSGDSVCLDVETIYLGGKEHVVRTGSGSVSVIVYGDPEKPALVTYPDLALNHVSCFQGLFFCPEAATLLLHNFCVYHISPPGHEMGAAAICADDPVPSVSDLADQVLEVLNYCRLGAVMCMGVMAGAYILTLFAMKFRERVLGLILVSPLCKAPSWTEWLCNKVMSNLLYYYGMCSLLKDCLLYRYFSKEVCGSAEVPESDIVQACRKLLDDRQSTNVLRFLQAINRRPDITDEKLVTINNHGSDAVLHVQCVYMDVLYINACKRFKHCPIMEQCYYTGSSLQVSGHGGAAIRNVSAHGIFSPGVWYTQKKSLKDSANLVQIPSNQCLKKTSILRMWRLMRFVRNEQIVFLNTYKTGTMWIDDRILGTSAYVRHM